MHAILLTPPVAYAHVTCLDGYLTVLRGRFAMQLKVICKVCFLTLAGLDSSYITFLTIIDKVFCRVYYS